MLVQNLRIAKAKSHSVHSKKSIKSTALSWALQNMARSETQWRWENKMENKTLKIDSAAEISNCYYRIISVAGIFVFSFASKYVWRNKVKRKSLIYPPLPLNHCLCPPIVWTKKYPVIYIVYNKYRINLSNSQFKWTRSPHQQRKRCKRSQEMTSAMPVTTFLLLFAFSKI